MAYDELLAQRVRTLLSRLPSVEEKAMFGGLTFMVNGKMCVNVGQDRIMCRIDPATHDEQLTKRGCRAVVMKGRECRGWLLVSEEAIASRDELHQWVTLALAFNRLQKSRPAKKRRSNINRPVAPSKPRARES